MSITNLEEQIKKYRKQYWEEGISDISDAEYDSLLLKLAEYDENHPLLTEIESSIISDKVKHPTPCLSLNKCFSFDEMMKWMKSVSRDENERFVFTPKYDGLACRWYQSMRTLATRGDGEEGENITDKRHLIELVISESEKMPLNTYEGDIEGELICTNENFAVSTLTRSNNQPYKTPRNLVAGVMNTLDTSHLIDDKGNKKVVLTLVKYDAVKYSRRIKDVNKEEFENICKAFDELGVPTDGVVIRVEDGLYGDALGMTSHHPKHSIALKFPDEVKTAKLQDVVFQTGKNKITPVAIIPPTEIDGVTVQRITLHNAKFCIDNDIQIGDTLKIIRSGRVIPKVVGSIKGADRSSIKITYCPSCGGDIEYREPFLYCISDDCEGKYAKKIAYAASVLGLDDIGLGTIEKCVEVHKCRNILDILLLSVEEFLELEGFAETSALNAYNALQKVLDNPIPDYKVLASMSKEGLGQTIWKKILAEYSIDDLLDFDEFYLSTIPNIGQSRAKLIYEVLHDNVEYLSSMWECLHVISTLGEVETKPKICFSGKFPQPKAFYQNLAIQKGFDVASSVTKDLKYLVTNGATTSKVSKARNYGVRVISLDDFISDPRLKPEGLFS